TLRPQLRRTDMASALAGIRVIDFGQYIAGPLAAQLLADQGAEVIRVDPPGGPRWDTPANATWNRGTRSIVLDIKTEAGRSTARGRRGLGGRGWCGDRAVPPQPHRERRGRTGLHGDPASLRIRRHPVVGRDHDGAQRPRARRRGPAHRRADV